MDPFTVKDFEHIFCGNCRFREYDLECVGCDMLRCRLVKEADRLLARDKGRGANGDREMYIRFAIESRDEGCLPELEAA